MEFTEHNLPKTDVVYQYNGRSYYIFEKNEENGYYYYIPVVNQLILERGGPIGFNTEYPFEETDIPFNSLKKAPKLIDYRILQARKEWGMEANPIFA